MSNWLDNTSPEFRYMLLDRLRQECNYYFRNGFQNPDNLWGKDERTQIRVMKDIWERFSEEDKPVFISWDDILDYERRMCPKEKLDPRYLEPYIDRIYSVVCLEARDTDALYGDYIQQLVGTSGFGALLECELLESCGVVNGRQLYVLCDK